jgi:hypothetical protein
VANKLITSRARRGESETTGQEETIGNLRHADSKFRKEIDVSTMGPQNLMKENDKLSISARTPLDENMKLKHGNEILPDQRKQLISMYLKLTSGQRVCQNSGRCWQSDAEEMPHKVDCMASENQ